MTRCRWPPDSSCGKAVRRFPASAQADQVQQFQGALPGVRLSHAFVQPQRFAELLLDGMQRVERGHRLLEDHGDAVAAYRAHRRSGGMEQFLAVEPDAAAGVRSGGVGQQLQDAERGDRLAGAGFADQGDGLAAVDRQGQALDGVHGAALGTEIDRQVLYVQQRRHAASKEFLVVSFE